MVEESINLTLVSWAHAVNSQKELTNALKSDVAMIEADIVLGKINSTGPNQPIMAHPPQKISDISLDTFLKTINEHNSNGSNHGKGIKLDFKSIEVFENSLDILRKHIPMLTCPIWLNADIISGPVNAKGTIPVDPDRFFAGCSEFQEATLSIGWTTLWGPNYVEGFYTDKHINDMVQVVKQNNATKHKITFPVRAGIAAQSVDQLQNLLLEINSYNESSLTIWSSQDDYVDIDKLRKLIFTLGLDRVYLDIPAELLSKLNLNKEQTVSVPISVN